jgi:hypothetical protein
MIVELTSAILNAASANDSDDQVSNSDVLFGVDPEKDIRKEDIDDQDSDSDEESSLDDEMDEEEDEKVVAMSITPLQNMKYRAELNR